MDEDFAYFLEKMGPPVGRRYAPPSSIERYRGKLPDRLLAYWDEHGWCGYAAGLFWTVNPQDYEPVVEAWIGDTAFMQQDAYHLIARSAFGKLYFWGERTGHSLTVFAPGSFAVPRKTTLVGDKLNFAAQTFFGGMSREQNDFEQMFAPAKEKLGALKTDEMYGFVPAIALGGPSTVAHLQTVKAVEHLVILAQCAPLDVITSPPF